MIGIKDRLLGKGYKKKYEEQDLIRMHHNIMTVYGWIPFKEFKTLPIPTIINLNILVNEEIKKREELRLYTLKFYGVKNPK